MEKNKKMLIGIAAVMLVFVLLIVIIVSNAQRNNNEFEHEVKNDIETYEKYVQELHDGSKINISNELLKPKTYNDLEITNISLKYTNEITTFVANVTNKGVTTKEEQKIYIVLVDQNGTEVERLKAVIDKVEAGKTVKLNMAITKDVVNAYSLKIIER